MPIPLRVKQAQRLNENLACKEIEAALECLFQAWGVRSRLDAGGQSDRFRVYKKEICSLPTNRANILAGINRTLRHSESAYLPPIGTIAKNVSYEANLRSAAPR